jgi:bifunctional DNA-binding transcriptional regulator/antitoxin component of YhaV-PrlF toxin-antitoxin module
MNRRLVISRRRRSRCPGGVVRELTEGVRTDADQLLFDRARLDPVSQQRLFVPGRLLGIDQESDAEDRGERGLWAGEQRIANRTSGRDRREASLAFTVIVKAMARISAKNQVTIPVAALEEAGLQAGDQVVVEALEQGELRIRRGELSFQRAFGALTGTYPAGYLERLDREDAER